MLEKFHLAEKNPMAAEQRKKFDEHIKVFVRNALITRYHCIHFFLEYDICMFEIVDMRYIIGIIAWNVPVHTVHTVSREQFMLIRPKQPPYLYEYERS